MRPESKKEPPTLFDMGDCHDIFTNGIAKIEFLPGNCVRLTCHVYEDDRRTVVAKCVWPIDELLVEAKELVAALESRGHMRNRPVRSN